MKTEGGGSSHGGGDGYHNEDAYVVADGLGLYVVCDGASERPAGEIASQTAVAALEAFVQREQRIPGSSLAKTFSSFQVAGRAARSALSAVLETSCDHQEFDGMSTTISMLLVCANRGAISHVGDSRVYLHRNEQIHQLTWDHDLATKLDVGGNGGARWDIDTFAVDLRARDTFLLCTDGAEEVVEDPRVLQDVDATSPRELASRIVSAAHRNNPGCDATVVVVRVREDDDPEWLWLSKPPETFLYGHAVSYA